MRKVGVRELKTRASEIVREVRESRARYVVTYRGAAVGVLAPLESVPEPLPADDNDSKDPYEDLWALGEEIDRRSRTGKSGVEILSEMRR